MKELILELARQTANGEVSEEKAKANVRAIGKDVCLWNEMIDKIRQWSPLTPNAYFLADLLYEWAEKNFPPEYLYEAMMWKGWSSIVIDSPASMDCFTRCHEYYVKNKMIQKLYECYRVYGDGFALADRIAKAMEYYQQMMKLALENRNDKMLAIASYKVGAMQKKLGKIEEAFEGYEKAMELMGSIDEEGLIAELTQSFLEMIKEFDLLEIRLEHYETLLECLERNKRPKMLAVALREMGTTFAAYGHKEKAVECLNKAVDALQGTQSQKMESDLLTQIGNVYQTMGDYLKAIQHFEKARKVLRESAGTKESPAKPSKESKPKLVKSDTQEWEVELIEEDEQEIFSYKQQLTRAKEEQNLGKQASLLHTIGNTCFGLGKLDQAMQSWRESLDISKQIENIFLAYQNYYRLGLLSCKRGDLESAREEFAQGIQVLEEMKDFLGQHSQKFLDENGEIFHHVVDACLSMGNVATAFHFLEQALRWKFLSRMGDAVLLSHTRVPDDLKQEYAELSQKLQRTYAGMQKEDLGKEREGTLKGLREYRSRLNELRTNIEVLDPEWASLFGRQFHFDPASLQQNLAEGTVLLEFFMTQEKGTVFMVSHDRLEAIPLPDLNIRFLRKVYEPFVSLDQFRRLWQDWCIECKFGTGETQEKLEEKLSRFKWHDMGEAEEEWKLEMEMAFAKISHAMLGKLIPKIEEYGADRLVLIPSGALQLFPIHLLPLLEDAEEEILLRDRYEVVYFPSATLFLLSCKREPHPENRLLLLNHTGNNFRFFQEELRMLQNSWHGEVLLQADEEATPEKLCEKGEEVSFLHFGGYSRSTFPDPFNSALHLSTGETNEVCELRIPDIIGRMKFKVKVVTLSAHEREVSDWENDGNGMGLVQALLYSGAQAVVCSAWPVPDLLYFLLIEKFYHGLAQGLSAAMALQEAQQEIRSMKGADISKRLSQQQKLLPESKSGWLKKIGQFLQSPEAISREDFQETISHLLAHREFVMAGMGDLKDIAVKDFFFPRTQQGKWPTTAFALDGCPFSHPYYWGGFFCAGFGLTKTAVQEVVEEDIHNSVYIDELGFSPDEDAAAKDIEEALCVLTEEGIKAYETITSAIRDNELLQKEAEKHKKYRVKGRCPNCGKKIRCVLSGSGGKARCPHCHKKIKIPPRPSPFDDMKVPALCPHCAESIHCFLPMAGKKAKCPKCHKRVKIPKREILLSEIAAGDPNSRILLLND